MSVDQCCYCDENVHEDEEVVGTRVRFNVPRQE